jgi:hypothetical protein
VKGSKVGELYQGQKIFDVVIWGSEEVRNDVTAMRDLFTQTGAFAAGGLNLSDATNPMRVNAGVVTPGFFTTLGAHAQLGREVEVGGQQRAETGVQVKHEAFHARRPPRPAEDAFGDEDFADVVEHRGVPELPEPRVVEAERPARRARDVRDADAVEVGRGARALEAHDEGVDAFVAAAARADGLEAGAGALEIVGPARVNELDGGSASRA